MIISQSGDGLRGRHEGFNRAKPFETAFDLDAHPNRNGLILVFSFSELRKGLRCIAKDAAFRQRMEVIIMAFEAQRYKKYQRFFATGL